MGLLDDAIREHLELKRRSGADPGEISRLESEALGPVRRSPTGVPDLGEPRAPEPDELEPDRDELLSPEPEPEPGRPPPPPSLLDPEPDEPPPLREPLEPPTAFEPPPPRESPPAHEPPATYEPRRAYEPPEPPVPLRPPPIGRDEPRPPLPEPEPELAREPAPDVGPPAPEHRSLLSRFSPSRRRRDHDEIDEPLRTGDEPGPVPYSDELLPEEPAPPAHERRPPIAPPPFEPEIVPADDEPEGEDLLEETPEFLEETPEHDRLWFEQRPPRDFDFDG